MCATAPVAPRLPPYLVNTRAHRPARAVAVVGQRLDDDGDAARPIALVADRLVGVGIGARGLLDGALDIVLGHVLRARRLDGEAQARVHLGIGHAVLGGDRDLARELGEQLGPGRVLAALAVHDVLELRMAGHLGPKTYAAYPSTWSRAFCLRPRGFAHQGRSGPALGL